MKMIDLMEKRNKLLLYQSLLGLIFITLLLLMVPWIAMQITDEVSWGAADFIIAGTLVFGTGLSYQLIRRRSASNIVYRVALCVALGATLSIIWANLAVGLIGSGPHPGNLLYSIVIAILGIRSIQSRFQPVKMERTMYAAAIALMLIALVALITGMHKYPESSVTEIITVNGFFAILFCTSGFLFRYGTRVKAETG